MNKALAFLAVLLTAAACGAVPAQDSLTFNPGSYTAGSLTLPSGKKVDFKAYEKLYFVANVEDSTYQYMNVYVPEGAKLESECCLSAGRTCCRDLRIIEQN